MLRRTPRPSLAVPLLLGMLLGMQALQEGLGGSGKEVELLADREPGDGGRDGESERKDPGDPPAPEGDEPGSPTSRRGADGDAGGAPGGKALLAPKESSPQARHRVPGVSTGDGGPHGPLLLPDAVPERAGLSASADRALFTRRQRLLIHASHPTRAPPCPCLRSVAFRQPPRPA